jgi:hypothetical protein
MGAGIHEDLHHLDLVSRLRRLGIGEDGVIKTLFQGPGWQRQQAQVEQEQQGT